MILIPLIQDHKLICQVSGPGVHIIKLLPALTITDADRLWVRDGFDKAIADCHRVPGAAWDLGRNLAAHVMKAKGRPRGVIARDIATAYGPDRWRTLTVRR